VRRFRGIGQKAPAFTPSQPALLASGLAMTTPPPFLDSAGLMPSQ
jgi:hypothetical protein